MNNISKNKVIENTIQFVKNELSDAEGGHDFFHIERVYKNALLIALEEDADKFIVSLGALLHDIADSKFHNGNETIGPKKARIFLENQKISEEIIIHIENIIKNISFKGGNFDTKFTSTELSIIQDADRLDAIGAIGIARCFNYGGYKNRKIYNPSIIPDLNMTKEQYKKSTAPTINHFYEKLLLLKDQMYTDTGKKIAQKRHTFMEDYLNQFYNEWDGNS